MIELVCEASGEKLNRVNKEHLYEMMVLIRDLPRPAVVSLPGTDASLSATDVSCPATEASLTSTTRTGSAAGRRRVSF